MVYKMKLWKSLTVIASIGAIIQFFKWSLDSLAGEKLGGPVSLLFSIIFMILVIITLILNKLKEDNRKIKEFLKKKGFKEVINYEKNIQ